MQLLNQKFEHEYWEINEMEKVEIRNTT